MEYKVLEFKHHAPYDGCFWEWNLFLVVFDGSGEDTIVDNIWPIYFSGDQSGRSHKFDIEMAQKMLRDPEDNDIPWTFDTIYAEPLDDDLWDKMPTNLIPTLIEFFNGSWINDSEPAIKDLGYTFKWKCGFGGELTSELAFLNNGYRGNGGVGLEYDGWVCEEHEGEYCYEQSRHWTEEVLRITFQDWLGDDSDLEILSGEVLHIMDEKFNFSVMDDGGAYPKDEKVQQALEFMGFRAPRDDDDAADDDPPQEYMDIAAQIAAGQLGLWKE